MARRGTRLPEQGQFLVLSLRVHAWFSSFVSQVGTEAVIGDHAESVA
jgi:hypothetical protein